MMRQLPRLLKSAPFLLLLMLAAALIPLGTGVGVPTSGAAALYEGYHDQVNCNTIRGWAWDRNAPPKTRVRVAVVDDATGEVVASGFAEQFRQDLKDAGIGDGSHGFVINTPAWIKDGATHSIRVKIAGTNFSLGNTPRSFNSTATPGCTVTSPPITMTVLERTPESKHANFRVQATGFSVSRLPDRYNVYGTSGYDLWRWNADNTGWDSLYAGGYPYEAGREDCSHATDPRLWHPKCSSDAIGYFWKRVSCPGGGVACQDNDRWNASPGTYNLTTFASPEVWPNPNTAADFGTSGYDDIINAGSINAVAIQPAGSGCRQYADTVWLDDTLPKGAVISAEGGDEWKWAYPSPSPTPYPIPGLHDPPLPAPNPVGAANPEFPPPPHPSWLSHQSKSAARMHQHYFLINANNAASRLKVNTGDKLFAYVYLHSGSAPRQVMLQWHVAGGGWQRAYWGPNLLGWPGYQAGGLPSTGVWHRLEVDADQVGLAGKTLDGMAFTLYDGQATWDRAGKARAASGFGCPPKTGVPPEKSFHAYNPDDFATGAANPKAVRVKYDTGQTRWFMAFNKQIKFVTPTYGVPGPRNYSRYGGSAMDNWQMMWATSNDGANWTIHPRMLLRSVLESQSASQGVLVTDMTIDEGHFYVLFQDLARPHLYLIRAPIDTVYSTTSAGYVSGGWRIAASPLQANGEYTWKSFTLGAQLDLEQLGAYPVMPSRNWTAGGFVKQAAWARVFSSTSPGTSLYFGVTRDITWGGDGRWPIQLWKTDSLSKPFQYESEVVISDPSRMPGAFDWEFGFSHYIDNTAATPRIVSNGFDFWIIENLQPLSPTGAPNDGLVTLSRHTAKLKGF